MKKLFIKTSLAIVAILFMVTACEKGPIMFDSSKNVVGFTTSSIVVKENLSGIATMYLGAATGTEATTLTLTIDTVGLGKSAAKEGVDFNLSSKSVLISVSGATIDINPVNNDLFTGDKKFYIVISSNSKNYLISAQNRFLVTISDDEHPLKQWLGTYSAEAVSYGDPGNWDEVWDVTVTSVEGNIDQLSIVGLGNGSDLPLIATIDKEALTITINSGQEIGEAYGAGNGSVKLCYGTDEIIDQVLAQAELTSAMITAASAIKITGTIEANGTIHLDKMGMILADYNWCWDVFNTTWTKQ
jgi:hypothetical protein